MIKSRLAGLAAPSLLALASLSAPPASAFEIITAEDVSEQTIVRDHLVRVVDNVIVLFDTSSSMNEEFRDTGESKLDIARAEFKKRNEYFPELGHLFAVYEYTPWREVYPFHTFDRAELRAALDTLPERGSGPTPLAAAVDKAEDVIQRVAGRTALFLFYDGQYTGRNPDPGLWRITHEYDVCLVLVSSASEEENVALRRNVARLNPCSRVIAFEDFIDRPEYTTGLLFDVIATADVVTRNDLKLVDVEVDNLLFNFDQDALTAQDREELDELGRFMAANPSTYAVVAGYTDNVGITRYNENLSRERAEEVAHYLRDEHGIAESRLVLHWYGERNPIASNETDEGRAKNRRVEVLIGGL